MGTGLIPGYDLASLLSLRFAVLPAKVITFPESSKLFVEESKILPNDFCMKTSITVTANMQIYNVLGVTLGFNLFRIIQVLNEKANGIF